MATKHRAELAARIRALASEYAGPRDRATVAAVIALHDVARGLTDADAVSVDPRSEAVTLELRPLADGGGEPGQ